jgi:type IV pilus assembly protein PilA
MKSTKCQSCGFVGFSATENCKSCGAKLIQRAAPVTPPGPNYGPTSQSPQGQKKGLAIFALVLGILGFMTFGLLGVGAITGIILAVIAMNRAGRQPWIYGGRSIAIAALVLNITSLTMTVPIGIIAAIAIPNLLASRRAANEGSAIHTLRTVSAAEATYQSLFQRYGTLQELASEQLIDPALSGGLKNGYKFSLEITKNADNLEGYNLVGVPLTYQSTGRRSFFINETGVIRAADAQGGPSTEFDPPLFSDYDYRRTAYRDQ